MDVCVMCGLEYLIECQKDWQMSLICMMVY